MTDHDDAPRRTRPDRWDTIMLAAAALAMPIYYWLRTPRWFNFDDWDLLATRQLGSVDDILRTHFGHPSMTPTVIYRTLTSVFGIESLPFHLLAIGLHCTTALLMYALIRRIGVAGPLAMALSLAFLFYGDGHQNITYIFGMTFTGSLALGVASLLVAPTAGPWSRRDTLATTLAVMSLTFSAVGVTMVVVLVTMNALLRRWVPAVVIAGVTGGLFLTWFTLIEQPASEDPSVSHALDLLATHLLATVTTFGDNLLVALVLGTLVILGLARAVRRPIGEADAAVVLAGAIGAVFFLITTGFARPDVDVGLPLVWPAPRYLHITALLLLPALAVGAEAVARRGPRALGALGLGLAIAAVGNMMDVRGTQSEMAVYDDAIQQQILLAPRLAELAAVPDDHLPQPVLVPGVTLGWLRSQVAEGDLPEPTPASPEEIGATILQTSLAATTPDDFPGPEQLVCRTVTRRGLEVTLLPGDLVTLLDAPVVATIQYDGVRSNRVGYQSGPDSDVTLETLAGPLDVRFTSVPRGGTAAVCRWPADWHAD